MDDVLSFLIEAEELGLLSGPPPRVIPKSEPVRKRGKKAARAKRRKVSQ